MRAVLSVRARRPAGAADRSRGVLCRDRQRRRAADAACDRIHRARRTRRSTADEQTLTHDQLRRSRRVLSAQDHAAGRGGARHRRARSRAFRPMSAARPAPATTRTTPGSSASPTTSRSRSGSATTTPRASATLGGGATGGGVALPIFEPIIQAVWANVAPRTALAPPSPEAKRALACKAVDLGSGETRGRDGKAITECFRLDAKGKVADTQYKLVSRESAPTQHDRNGSPAGRPADNAAGYFWAQPADFNRRFRMDGPRGGCIPGYDSSGAQTRPC